LHKWFLSYINKYQFDTMIIVLSLFLLNLKTEIVRKALKVNSIFS
jgi:hypothetical protein